MDTVSPQIDVIAFEPLAINDATIEDLWWIKTGMETLHSGLGLREVFIDLERNSIAIYRITGNSCYGIIMLKLTTWPEAKELELYMMAGEGLIKVSNFNQIWEFTRSIARDKECKWLSTSTSLPTLIKLYTRRFGPPASAIFREEL